MKLKWIKCMALTMVITLGITTVACSNKKVNDSQSNNEVTNLEHVITTINVGENEVLVYYPKPNTNDELVVNTTCTTASILVFGDKKYDNASAEEYITKTGLDKIASNNGASICFINPVGETWSESDDKAYETIAQAFSDSSTAVRENGISKEKNFMSGEEEQKITGSQGRIYVYGIGLGADYVASHMLRSKIEAPTFWGGVIDVTPSGITLENVSDLSKSEENYIPVVSVGNSDDINNKLKDICKNINIDKDANYTNEFNNFIGVNRRQAGVLLPIYNWEEEGIVEKIETYTVNTSDDNVTFAGQDKHDINYITYYAKDLDIKSGNVPLVMCFHGGGSTALFEAQATEWPLIGKENGFITVSVDMHFPNCTPTEIVDLIKYIETQYSIDSTRIYASGFSMGGCKSWDLYEQYPEIFAGLAPMDATMEVGKDSFGNDVKDINTNTVVPLFYVGGELSPLPELPFQEKKVVDRVKNVFEVNNVVTKYTSEFDDSENWSNKIWGIDGDITYTVTDKKAFKDSVLTVMLFESIDGKYYTAFTSASNQSHEVYARNSWAAWDFLSQFSRAEDGTILIDKKTYKLSSDDGNVKDNFYNN